MGMRLKKKNKRIQVWRHIVEIPALVGMKHGDQHEFEANLNCTVKPCLQNNEQTNKQMQTQCCVCVREISICLQDEG